MITSEREYRVTKAAAKKFEEALKNFDAKSSILQASQARLLKAEKEGIASQLDTLRNEIYEYERLNSERVIIV